MGSQEKEALDHFTFPGTQIGRFAFNPICSDVYGTTLPFST